MTDTEDTYSLDWYSDWLTPEVLVHHPRFGRTYGNRLQINSWFKIWNAVRRYVRRTVLVMRNMVLYAPGGRGYKRARLQFNELKRLQ